MVFLKEIMEYVKRVLLIKFEYAKKSCKKGLTEKLQLALFTIIDKQG